jgi:hypothetical protein
MKIDPNRDSTAAMIIKKVKLSEKVEESVENMDKPRYANKNASAAYAKVDMVITLPSFDSSDML